MVFGDQTSRYSQSQTSQMGRSKFLVFGKKYRKKQVDNKKELTKEKYQQLCYKVFKRVQTSQNQENQLLQEKIQSSTKQFDKENLLEKQNNYKTI